MKLDNHFQCTLLFLARSTNIDGDLSSGTPNNSKLYTDSFVVALARIASTVAIGARVRSD